MVDSADVGARLSPGAENIGDKTARAALAPLLPGGEPVESLLRQAQFFTAGTPTPDHREVHRS
ncbi:MAG: hypothetical protein ACRDTV_16480, partial [Mycobacterium sp.]